MKMICQICPHKTIVCVVSTGAQFGEKLNDKKINHTGRDSKRNRFARHITTLKMSNDSLSASDLQ
jgi:hypothetical protein